MGKICCLLSLAIIAALLFGVSRYGASTGSLPAGQPQKIVSLAPAITETLYALGLGDKVAGVTEFCAWPPEAASKPKTGGFREVNLEAIAQTGADLVVLPHDMAHFKKAIEDMGIAVMLFDYQSLPAYLGASSKLGALCGARGQAADFVAQFDSAKPEKASGQRPAVLFALLNPDEYDAPIREMTVIGADGFYNDVIEAAGGRNAYAGKTPFPRMSLEAIIALDPDVIVVGAPELAKPERLAARWREIGHLKGARDGRLLLLTDPGDTIPGPRSLGTISKLAQTIAALPPADQTGAR